MSGLVSSYLFPHIFIFVDVFIATFSDKSMSRGSHYFYQAESIKDNLYISEPIYWAIFGLSLYKATIDHTVSTKSIFLSQVYITHLSKFT